MPRYVHEPTACWFWRLFYSIHFCKIKTLDMGLQKMVTIHYRIIYYTDFVVPCGKPCLLQNGVTKKEKKKISSVQWVSEMTVSCTLETIVNSWLNAPGVERWESRAPGSHLLCLQGVWNFTGEMWQAFTWQALHYKWQIQTVLFVPGCLLFVILRLVYLENLLSGLVSVKDIVSFA